ncbi:MAG: NAD(+)/NADH kinase [Oscillospiraceae bacterium]|nr:NAD(+)/NADH kinase [Oscillospiraceae bacterium]
MKVIICKNAKKKDDPNCEKVNAVRDKLRELGYEAEYSEEAHGDCDFIVTVGGDGTILSHGKTAARLGKPLLGINTGRLGFITSVEFDELDKLKLLKEKKWRTCSRMMLDVEINGQKFSALNDAVFSREPGAKLPDFEVSSNGITISQFRADGLILSTPTGSTAYALSAGGPIIEPWMDCMELTPLCAHSLFGRPMILSAESPVIVKLTAAAINEADDGHAVYVSVDGDAEIRLKKGESAVISKSALRLALIELDGGGFYCAVRNKLMKPLK